MKKWQAEVGVTLAQRKVLLQMNEGVTYFPYMLGIDRMKRLEIMLCNMRDHGVIYYRPPLAAFQITPKGLKLKAALQQNREPTWPRVKGSKMESKL